jgi:iron complex outermembrane receptor protein
MYNFSYHSLFELPDKEFEFLFGSTRRDFGADSFYSALFPQEEEHTTQRFYLLRASFDGDLFDYTGRAYLRRHSDEFILMRHNPSFFANRHKTYVYGLQNEFVFQNDSFIAFGLEREKISSSNLANRRRLKKGLALGIKERRLGKFCLDLKAGLDYYGQWGYLDNSHAGLGYFLKEDTKLRLSFDRIWRAPSFTELYYFSPANIGNPNVSVQYSNNYELGIDYSPDSWNISLSVFLREESDTIDWVKNNAAGPWQARNVEDVTAYGSDVYIGLVFEDSFLEDFGLGYTYLELDKDSSFSFSKYVFDYNRHKAVVNLGLDMEGFIFRIITSFAKPADRKEYATLDVRIDKQMAGFTLSLEGTNIFNKDFQETAGIDAAGRWYKLSLSYHF